MLQRKKDVAEQGQMIRVADHPKYKEYVKFDKLGVTGRLLERMMKDDGLYYGEFVASGETLATTAVRHSFPPGNFLLTLNHHYDAADNLEDPDDLISWDGQEDDGSSASDSDMESLEEIEFDEDVERARASK